MTQLMVDLLSWSIVIYFSGGATNPLISLLLPVVAIGAAMLPTLQAWLLGAFSILTYSFLWNFYQPLEVKDATKPVARYWSSEPWISSRNLAVAKIFLRCCYGWILSARSDRTHHSRWRQSHR